MLSFLEGQIISISDFLVLECFGIGFEISMPERDMEKLEVGEKKRIEVSLRISPEGPRLYGFLNAAEKQIFSVLLKVPGIGPKAASRLISSLQEADLGFVGEEGAESDGVVEALESLGWKSFQAQSAYRSAKEALPLADSSALLKACLQILDRHA